MIAVQERSRDAVILCEDTLRPIFMNQRAMDLVNEGDGLSLGQGCLLASHSTAGRQLRDAILTACEDAGSSVRKLTVPRPSGRPPLMVSITPLQAMPSGDIRQRACVAVFVQTPDRAAIPDVDMLRSIFQFTRREAQVASMVASGQSLAAIAADLGMGVGTVRFHLKQVFAKTGVHSQAAVVSLLHTCTDAWS